MALWRKTEEGGGEACLAMGFSWSKPRDARRRNARERKQEYILLKLLRSFACLLFQNGCVPNTMSHSHQDQYAAYCHQLTPLGESIYSPIMPAVYYLTIKSARCCDEISKINIYGGERYISTRSNSFCTFNIFWLRPPVRHTNLRGVLSWLVVPSHPGNLSRCLL